jgi:hypothetical protein
MCPDDGTSPAANGSFRDMPRPQEADDAQETERAMTPARILRVLVFGAALLVLMLLGRPPLGVVVGSPSPADVTARVSFDSTDIVQTRAAQKHAALQQPPVFRVNTKRWQAGVQRLLDDVRTGKPADFEPYLARENERNAFAALLPRLQTRADALEKALGALPPRLVVDAPDLNQAVVTEKETAKADLLDPSGTTETVPVASLIPLSADSTWLRSALNPALAGLTPDESALAARALASILAPGATLDLERTRDSADRAARQAPIATKYVERGRLIVAQGADVSHQHVEDLSRERAAYWSSWEGHSVMLQRATGLGVLLMIVLATGVVPCLRYRPRLLDNRPQMLAFCVLTLALVAAARICVVRGATPLWVPVPMMVMIMCLVYDQRFGLGVALFYSLLVRLATPGGDMGFMVLLLGGLTAALLTGQVRTRGALIKVAMATGLAQFVAVWGLALMSARSGAMLTWRFWEQPYLNESLAGLVNGVLGGFIVSGLLPTIERLFGVTTDIRLLEWSDPNQPLLQRLLLEAPGTYHHSMIVGSLAADAAEAIGANPLLARVSAYFHDVGKLKKPEYFAENIPAGSHNPHDDLSPTMSTLIITAHPKDGAEMAEEYGVPAPVRDVILQSHGTGILKYFLNKAREGETESDVVRERDFRYRLLKPQRKEAALVMICDAVESAARSMGSPTPAQLRNLVRQIILDRLNDGQLDESSLTITDVKRIGDTLVHGLAAAFHNRVRYPGQEQLEQPQPAPEPPQNGATEDQPGAGGDQQSARGA